VNRSEKAELIASLNKDFQAVNLLVVTRQSGLTVAEVSDLRRKVRAAGASYKVSKNRLTRLALEGTAFKGIGSLLTGPTAIASSKDPVAAAKVVSTFAKDNEKLTIVGGSLNGQTLDADGVKELASLPSLDELRAKLLALFQTPATRIAGVVQAPAGQLARVLSAYGSKDESSGQAA
jgi:large subunit ribosomal protein L10